MIRAGTSSSPVEQFVANLARERTGALVNQYAVEVPGVDGGGAPAIRLALTLGSQVPGSQAAFGDRGGTVRVAEQVERRAPGDARKVGGLGRASAVSGREGRFACRTPATLQHKRPPDA